MHCSRADLHTLSGKTSYNGRFFAQRSQEPKEVLTPFFEWLPVHTKLIQFAFRKAERRKLCCRCSDRPPSQQRQVLNTGETQRPTDAPHKRHATEAVVKQMLTQTAREHWKPILLHSSLATIGAHGTTPSNRSLAYTLAVHQSRQHGSIVCLPIRMFSADPSFLDSASPWLILLAAGESVDAKSTDRGINCLAKIDSQNWLAICDDAVAFATISQQFCNGRVFPLAQFAELADFTRLFGMSQSRPNLVLLR